MVAMASKRLQQKSLAMLWVCAHLPQMALEIYLRTNSRASLGAAVLVEDKTVCRMNRRAQEAGISLGVGLATANSLVADLVHYPRDIALEMQRLELLVASCYQFTPRVSLAPPDALLLEVQGSLKLFGGWEPIVRLLTQALRLRGHVCRVAIAHTPYAAETLARARVRVQLPRYPDQETVRSIAMALLQDVELVHTKLTEAEVERLFSMGIRLLGELLQLPRHELSKRFGKPMLDYLARLTGTLLDPREYVVPDPMFHAEIHLLEPIQVREELRIPMQGLATDLSSWLGARNCGVVELAWGFRPFGDAERSYPVHFAYPRIDANALLEFSELTLAESELPGEVISISLRAVKVDSVSKARIVGNNLFGSRDAVAVAPNDLMDRLAARLGTDSLQLLCHVNDHRPEHAWAPLSVRASSRRNRTEDLLTPPGKRPAWLLEPPIPVKRRHFELLRGPERIQSGWWDSLLERDYYVARHENGSLCWLFNDQRGWFQHGFFS